MCPTPRRSTPVRQQTATAMTTARETERRGATLDDRFFRHIVSSMRNGVIAIHRDGTIALMNREAYRIFSLPVASTDIGRPVSDVFRDRPDIVRVLSASFEM